MLISFVVVVVVVVAADLPSVCVCVQVPQRTTSISPALVRKNSPNGGVALGPRTGSQVVRAR